MGKMSFFPVLTNIFPFLSRDLLKKSLSLQRQNKIENILILLTMAEENINKLSEEQLEDANGGGQTAMRTPGPGHVIKRKIGGKTFYL